MYRAWALWEQYQKKAQLYRSNVILVPHGDDFRYDSTAEWDKQLGNMEKLMDFMNADRDMNIKVSVPVLHLVVLYPSPHPNPRLQSKVGILDSPCLSM